MLTIAKIKNNSVLNIPKNLGNLSVKQNNLPKNLNI